jgi:hypothetical protein
MFTGGSINEKGTIKKDSRRAQSAEGRLEGKEKCKGVKGRKTAGVKLQSV